MGQLMAMISDMLLVAGAFAAALYCAVLARRLRRFTDLEHGVGGAVAVLSAQVDDLTHALGRARGAAAESVAQVSEATMRAEAATKRLELLVASLHDLQDQPRKPAPTKLRPEPEEPRSDAYFIRGVRVNEAGS